VNILPSRRFLIRCALISALALAVRLVLFGEYLPTIDDYFVALTADAYGTTGQPYPLQPFHPVLRNLLTSASMELFGRGALGVKFFSLAAGVLMIPALALFVRRAVRDERAGLFAAGLAAVDLVLVDFSRQGVQETHAALFALLGMWLTIEAFRTHDWRAWRWLLPTAGVLFGMGLASKMYALMPLLVSLVLLLVVAGRRRRWDSLLLAATSLTFIPLTVYLATYAPWFTRGYDIAEWITFQLATAEAMTTHVRPVVGIFSNADPLMWFVQPLYWQAEYAVTAAGPQLMLGFGNPLVWLAVLPAAAYSLLVAAQRRRDWILHVYFWAAYLPLALATRPIWLLSAVPVVPLAFGIVASVLAALQRGRARTAVAVYLIAVLVSSALLMPLALGRALDMPYLRPIVDPVMAVLSGERPPVGRQRR